MKLIQINSVDRTITEVEVPEITLEVMQKYVGGNFECAHVIDEKNELYVDEEGLLKIQEGFFFYEGAHQPFPGNGIIVGHDEEDTVGCTLSVEEVTPKIRFMNPLEALQLAKEMGV